MLNVLKKAASIGKKIFIIIAVYFVIVSLFLHFINQDKPNVTIDPVKKNRESIYSMINNPQLNNSKEGKKIIAAYRIVFCGFLGEGCTNSPTDGDTNYKNSIFGKVSSLISLPLQNPPASGIYWAYSGLQNAGFVPKAYAAEGIGFAGLKPLLNLWKAFRDIAYMILVLVLIAIGFMIMFRMKLNPQTVISAENALPRIVLSLILITFSFAIAGFLIDVMYIIITLGIAAIGNRGNLFNVAEIQNRYINANALEVWGSLFPSKAGPNAGWGVGGWQALNMVSQAFMNLIPDFLSQILRFLVAVLVGGFILTKVGHPIWDALGDAANIGAGVGAVVTAILKLIGEFTFLGISFIVGYSLLPLVFLIGVGVTLILMFFRIFFLLFACYLKILLLIVFSPVFMVFEALPGRNAFGYWFKTLFAEIITFPVVIIIFVVTYVIVTTPASTGALWTPPFMNDINPNAFTALLGFGIMLQIPEFVKVVKETLGVKGMPIGLNLGTFFGGAVGTVGGGLGLVGQVGSISLGMKAIFGDQFNIRDIIAGKLGPKKTTP